MFFDRNVDPPLHTWLLGRFAEAKLTPHIVYVYATTQPQTRIDLVRAGVGALFVAPYVLRSLACCDVARPKVGAACPPA